MASLIRFRSLALLSALMVLFVLTARRAPTASSTSSHDRSTTESPSETRPSSSPPTACARTSSRGTPTRGLMPTMSKFLKHGISATGNGLLTQAPPNTGAGWYSLATGAWPGVHGSTNNTFHINGQPFANRTAAFDANVLQAESIAQSAERGGLKVAQVEWAGGRNATIQGPTIDFQSFFSGRGVATNFIGHAGRAALRRRGVHRGVRPPVRPSGRIRRPGAVPGRRADGRDRLDQRPGLVQPGEGDASPRPRLRRRQVRPQRVHLRQPQRRQDDVRQGPLLADQERRRLRRHPPQGRVGRRQGEDHRRRAGRPDRRHARQGRGAHAATCRASASSTPPSAGRSPAGRRGRASPGSPATSPSTSRRRSRPRPPPTSRSSKPASRPRRRTSSRACTGPPATRRCSSTSSRRTSPDLLLAGMPTTDEFQHQFLGLVSPKLPGGAPNPAYDDVDLNGVPDGRVAEREAFIRTRLRGGRRDPHARPQAHGQGSDDVRRRPTTASRRSSWPSTRASRSSSSACCRGRRRPTAARRPVRRSARPRPAGPAAPFRST